MITDLILPIVCNKYKISYVIFDEELKIFDFTENMNEFVEVGLEISKDSDIREYFWEFVGLEGQLEELFLDKKSYLHLPLISRNDKYYDINIEICFIENKKYYIAMFTKQLDNSVNYLKTIQRMNENNLKNYFQNDNNQTYYNVINKKLISFHIDKEGFIKKVNSACTSFLGVKEEDMLGKHFSKYFLYHEGKSGSSRISNIIKAENKDGLEVFFHVDFVPVHSDDLSDEIVICHDITYLKRIETELEYAATHDSLTGLPNRLYLKKEIEKNIEKCKINNSLFALCFIDLNKFKAINDNYGHHVGDMLLKHVGEVLSIIVREQDTVSRLGGDEFVILFEYIESIEYLDKTITRIKEVSKTMPLYVNENIVIDVTFSLGVSIYPYDGENIDSLLDSADKNMYLFKKG